jgi:hypothetical protein
MDDLKINSGTNLAAILSKYPQTSDVFRKFGIPTSG